VPDNSRMVFDTDQGGTHEVIAYVTDSMGKTASDSIQITVRERPQGGLLGEGILDNATVAGEGLGGETSLRQEGEGGVTIVEPATPPPPTVSEEGEGTPPSTKEEEEEEPPLGDDTGG
jgi:hypothetical protein